MMNFVKNECGQGLAEYALILALIAIVVIATLRALGSNINQKLGVINSEMNTSV